MFAWASYGAFPYGGAPLPDPHSWGDSLRDAFRARLAVHRATAGIAWPVKDTLNTGEHPDASVSFLDLEFPGGSEEFYARGGPGGNLHLESGQVTIRICTPLNAGSTERNTAENYARQLRDLFRRDSFVADSRTVRIVATAPMGGGHDEAGLWVESVALRYETFNVG